MHSVTGRIVVSLVSSVLVAAPLAAQEEVPPDSGGERECATSLNQVDALEAVFLEFLSDPGFAPGRAADGLETLPSDATMSVLVTRRGECLRHVRTASTALGDEMGGRFHWRDMEYVVLTAGPYVIVLDRAWTGSVKPAVVISAASGEAVAVIWAGY